MKSPFNLSPRRCRSFHLLSCLRWAGLISMLHGLAAAAPGDLDPAFGTAGVALTDLGASVGARAVALQADGKIIVAGTVGGDFAVARLHPNGTLDPSFDGDGRVLTAVGSGNDVVSAVVVQQDGKIIVAGTSADFPASRFSLVRYQTDGSLDASFDGDGRVIVAGLSAELNALLLQPDGRIVAGGTASGSGSLDFALVRLNGNGTLDGTFGTGGIVTTDVSGGTDKVNGLALAGGGCLVVAGASASSSFTVGRYLPTGVLDSTFSGDGIVTTPTGSGEAYASSVVVGPGDKIICAGWSIITHATGYYPEMFLARYLPDGSLDNSFSTDGKVSGHLGSGGKVAMQADGKIVVMDGAVPAYDEAFEPLPPFFTAVARFLSDGTPDGTFGSGGVSEVLFSNSEEEDSIATGLVLQGDGKIVIAGSGGVPPKCATARLDGGLVFAPEIVVEQPAGFPLMDGVGSVGMAVPWNQVKTFTIRNTGTASLTGLALSLHGAQAGNFTLGTLGATNLAPGGSTTFTVTAVTPQTLPVGYRMATLRIASNDVDEDPFDVTLTLSAIVRMNWREKWFGDISQHGNGGDNFDPDRDGATNLLEFATASNPTVATQVTGVMVDTGAALEFTYNRANVALGECAFAVQWNDTVSAVGWSSAGVSEAILSDDGVTQVVKATVPRGTGAHRFVRLHITAAPDEMEGGGGDPL